MKIKVASVVDLMLLEKILADNGIEFTRRSITNPAFPIISAEESHEVEFQESVPDVENPVEEEVSWKKKRRKRLYIMAALTIYAVAASVLLLKYWDISRRSGADKNFIFEWNTMNTMLNVIHKGDLSFHSQYYDGNYDGNYESIESFAKDRLMIRSTDRDENGLNERMEYFGMDGRRTGVSVDNDQDGLYDTSTMVLQDGRTLHFVDHNLDGVFELAEIK